jgi:hypothetical protein
MRPGPICPAQESPVTLERCKGADEISEATCRDCASAPLRCPGRSELREVSSFWLQDPERPRHRPIFLDQTPAEVHWRACRNTAGACRMLTQGLSRRRGASELRHDVDRDKVVKQGVGRGRCVSEPLNIAPLSRLDGLESSQSFWPTVESVSIQGEGLGADGPEAYIGRVLITFVPTMERWWPRAAAGVDAQRSRGRSTRTATQTCTGRAQVLGAIRARLQFGVRQWRPIEEVARQDLPAGDRLSTGRTSRIQEMK